MPRFLLLALNGPHAGDGNEEAYNRWYNEQHLPDLLAIPGVKSASRYKAVMQRRTNWPYIATYEIETDDPDAFYKALGTYNFDFPDAMDRDTSAMMLGVEIMRLDAEDAA